MNFMLFDPVYLVFLLPAILLAGYAQLALQRAYAKYSRIDNYSRITGAGAAQRVLAAAGIDAHIGQAYGRSGGGDGVRIELTQGLLADHYDPRSRTLRLSPQVYQGSSIAAVGIAAHEAGHAIQHANRYLPLHLRSAIVPLAGFGSWLAMPLIVLGALLGASGLIEIGIILFSAFVAFQLITLPVEFDASARAKQMLSATGITVTAEEEQGVRKVLSAAALTYVAATITAILTLLYYVMRFQNRN